MWFVVYVHIGETRRTVSRLQSAHNCACRFHFRTKTVSESKCKKCHVVGFDTDVCLTHISFVKPFVLWPRVTMLIKSNIINQAFILPCLSPLLTRNFDPLWIKALHEDLVSSPNLIGWLFPTWCFFSHLNLIFLHHLLYSGIFRSLGHSASHF